MSLLRFLIDNRIVEHVVIQLCGCGVRSRFSIYRPRVIFPIHLGRGNVLSDVGVAAVEVCKLFPVFIDKLSCQTAFSPQTDIKDELNFIDQTVIDVLYAVIAFVSNQNHILHV